MVPWAITPNKLVVLSAPNENPCVVISHQSFMADWISEIGKVPHHDW